MIYIITAVGFGSTVLFLGLLAVCRAFAAQNEKRELYEHLLWAKYAVMAASDTKRAAA